MILSHPESSQSLCPLGADRAHGVREMETQAVGCGALLLSMNKCGVSAGPDITLLRIIRVLHGGQDGKTIGDFSQMAVCDSVSLFDTHL